MKGYEMGIDACLRIASSMKYEQARSFMKAQGFEERPAGSNNWRRVELWDTFAQVSRGLHDDIHIKEKYYAGQPVGTGSSNEAPTEAEQRQALEALNAKLAARDASLFSPPLDVEHGETPEMRQAQIERSWAALASAAHGKGF
jgi:hypothetical protein